MIDNKIKSKMKKTTFKNIKVKDGATISPKLILPSIVIFFRIVCKTSLITILDISPTEYNTSLIDWNSPGSSPSKIFFKNS